MNYSEALKGDAPLIMGIVLKPLSLGHIINLFNEDCAVVLKRQELLKSADPKENIERLSWACSELQKALLICAMSFEDYQALQKDGREKARILSKYKRVVKRLRWKGYLDVFGSMKMFNEYLEPAFKDMPKFTYAYKSQSSNNTTKEDWFQPFLLELGGSLKMTRSEILNQPYELTKADFYGLAAKNGAINLKSDKEAALLEMNMKAFTPDGGINLNEGFNEVELIRMNSELMKNYGK